jgi:hypothetical protein
MRQPLLALFAQFMMYRAFAKAAGVVIIFGVYVIGYFLCRNQKK